MKHPTLPLAAITSPCTAKVGVDADMDVEELDDVAPKPLPFLPFPFPLFFPFNIPTG
jgi:hypothetical protein